MSKARFAIVGCGKIAVFHAEAVASLPDARIVACCDPLPGRAADFAAAHGIPRAYEDLDGLLTDADVEAVLVCTPHPTHVTVVEAAAAAGKHVLCEKPIAVRLDEADRMIQACDEAGVNFGVIFQRRFWPASQRVRRAIDDGRLGRPILGRCDINIWRWPEYFASDPWRGKWATEGGGVLMNQAPHHIDLLQWYLGRPVEVFGRIATLRHGSYIEVEDSAVATVRFESGALAVIQAATTFDPGRGFRIEIHGDRGPVVGIEEQPEATQGVNHVWTVPGEEEAAATWLLDERDRPGFPGFQALQIGEFAAALREGRPPAVTGRDARRSLEIVLGIYHSHATGAPVPLGTGDVLPAPAFSGSLR